MTGKRHFKEGTPEYIAWKAMKTRCLNSNIRNFKDYGGRGIKIYEPWIDCFMSFYEYIGDKPEPKRIYSLDRINNEGNYEPGNVRWATRKEQLSNKRLQCQPKYIFIKSTCKWCKSEFDRNETLDQIFCTKKCAVDFSSRKRTIKRQIAREKLLIKKCSECGIDFKNKRIDGSSYCSTKCYRRVFMRSYRKNQKLF